LDGVPAREVAFSAEVKGTHITGIQCIYIMGGYMYSLTCESFRGIFDKNKPIFDAIINSYTIKNASAETMPQTIPGTTSQATAIAAPEPPLDKMTGEMYWVSPMKPIYRWMIGTATTMALLKRNTSAKCCMATPL